MIINLERGFATYTNSDNSSVNYYGKPWMYAWSGVKAIYMYTPLTQAKGGVIPSLDNVLVNTGKLHLYVGQDLPASTTITVKRITEEWDYNKINDDDTPATTATNQGTLLTSATAGQYVEIDIVDMLQEVVDNKETAGYIWFGVEVTVDKTSDCVFASWRNAGLSSRPFVELKYSVPPSQPLDLRPMEGGVSSLTPVVAAKYTDDDSEDYCSKLQVQVNDTTDFSTPDYDSGTQATTSPSFQLPGGAGLSWETLAYWRIRLGDSYGVWSPWSDIASLTPLDLPTVAIQDIPPDTRMNSNYDFASGVGSPWLLDPDVNVNVLDANEGSVETGSADFQIVNSAVIVQSSTHAEHGTKSLKCTTSSFTPEEGWELKRAIAVSASQDHTASAFIIGEGLTQALKIGIAEYDSGDSLIGITYQNFDTNVNQFERYSVTRSFSASGVKARIRIVTQSDDTVIWYTDKLMIEQGSSVTGWHIEDILADITSKDNPEALSGKTAWVHVYNGGKASTAIRLMDITSFDGVLEGEILKLSARIRCSIADADFRFRIQQDDGSPTYCDDTEGTADAWEWLEHECITVMPASDDLRICVDLGAVDDFEHDIEIDYFSLHKCISSMAPLIHHHYTAGDNGAQVYAKRDLHFLNPAVIWERIGLTEWEADDTLNYQTPNGPIKDFGVYKINVKCQDGDDPRVALENSPLHAEDEIQFEIVYNPDLPTVEDPDGVLETVRYQEHYLDIAYTGVWSNYFDVEEADAMEYTLSNATDSTASFNFIGSEVKWIGAKAVGMGIAEVFIDGVSQGTVDLYNAGTLWQQELFTKDSLSQAEDVTHTIMIKQTGTKHASSSGYKINLDAFEITGPNIPWPAVDVEEAELDDILGENTYDYVRDGD